MLEKMGWEKGDGLGSERQGITDIISLKSVDENQGLGFKGNKDEWIAHQDDFTSVLADLNQHHGNGEEREGVASLESKSKSAKKRIHYHKYAKSKDTSRYSTSDLNSILGSEAVKKKRKVKDEEEEFSKEVSTSSNEPKKCSDGLVVIRGGNIHDYFAKKMNELKKRAKSSNQVPEESNGPSASEENQMITTEKKINENAVESENAPGDKSDSETPIKKKKKSKRKNKETELDPSMTEDFSENKKKNSDESKEDGEQSVDKNEEVMTKENSELVEEDKANKKKRKKVETFINEDFNQSVEKPEKVSKEIEKVRTKKRKRRESSSICGEVEADGDPIPKEDKKSKKCKKNKKKRGDNEDASKEDSKNSDRLSEERTLIKDSPTIIKNEEVPSLAQKSETQRVSEFPNKMPPNIKTNPGRNRFGSWSHHPRRNYANEDKFRLQNKMRELKRELLKKPVEELVIQFNGSNLQSLAGYGNTH